MKAVITTAERVRTVLSAKPETRHDVLALQFAVWEEEGLVLSAAQRSVITRLSQPETIRRTSRKILNEGA